MLERGGRDGGSYEEIWQVLGRASVAWAGGVVLLGLGALVRGWTPWFWGVLAFGAGFAATNLSSLRRGLGGEQRLRLQQLAVLLGAGLSLCLVQSWDGIRGPFAFVFLVDIFVYGFRLGRSAALATAAVNASVIVVLLTLELQAGVPLVELTPGLAVVFLLSLEGICISALVRQQSRWREALLRLAESDPLTGLMNRRTLHRALESNLDRGERFAVLLLDLDGFKAVNDSFGHLRGDEVLRGVAQAMLSAVRRSDIVIRYGGDEFAVLVEGGQDNAQRVYERLQQALVDLSGRIGLELRCSAGAALWPDDGRTLNDLLQLADRRLYRNKPGQREPGAPVNLYVDIGPEPHRPF